VVHLAHLHVLPAAAGPEPGDSALPLDFAGRLREQQQERAPGEGVGRRDDAKLADEGRVQRRGELANGAVRAGGGALVALQSAAAGRPCAPRGRPWRWVRAASASISRRFRPGSWATTRSASAPPIGPSSLARWVVSVAFR